MTRRTASTVDEDVFVPLRFLRRLDQAKTSRVEETLNGSPVPDQKPCQRGGQRATVLRNAHPQPIAAACSCDSVPSGTFQQRS